MPDPEPQQPAPRRSRRILVNGILAVSLVVGIFAVLAVWVNRQVLDTGNWTSTSTRLLANPKIQKTLGAVLVNELFEAVPVETELQKVLPGPLEALAGPATAGLREFAGQLAPELLASPAVQKAWRLANRETQLQFLQVLKGGGRNLSTNGGVVVLHLHPLIEDLASQLGLTRQLQAAREKLHSTAGRVAQAAAESKIGVKIPASGEIVLLRSKQLKTAQDVVKGIKGLSLVLPALAILLIVLAVWLAAGFRRVALRSAGWVLVATGILAVLSRHLIREMLVNALVKIPENRPAVSEAFEISTTLLYDIAIAVVTYGLVIVFAAWIAGPTRPARALRRVLAPGLREHPLVAYAAGALVMALLVLWGPFPSTRQALPVAGITLLLALGIAQLRSATGREFPGAERSDTGRAVRALFASRHGGPPAAA